jgi:hypothetical protein
MKIIITESEKLRILSMHKKHLFEDEGCVKPNIPDFFNEIITKTSGFLTYEEGPSQCSGGGGQFMLNGKNGSITLNTWKENEVLSYNLFADGDWCNNGRDTGRMTENVNEVILKYNEKIAPCLAQQYGKDLNSLKI